jgi:NNP family nitrate/nitrite transporter-like MFS transporter
MLPTFFADTFGLSAVVAGAAGSAYAVMNLVSRAAGGLFSDVLGNRRRTLLVLLLLIFAGPSAFFVAIGASAVAAAIACRWLPEPADGFAADHPDVGTATAADAP